MSLRNWVEALFGRDNKFEVSLLHLPGRLRMPPQWKIEDVQLDAHLFYFVVEGAFLAKTDEGMVRAATGDLVWAGAGSPFSFRLDKDEHLVVLRFRLKATHSDGTMIKAPHPLSRMTPAHSAQVFIERIIQQAGSQTLDNEEFRQYRLRALLACLFSEIEGIEQKQTWPAGQLTPMQCELLRRIVSEHPGGRLKPLDLARAVELSPDYFSRCFTRTFGVSPRRFLLDERMRSAALRLLESNASVSQIAHDLGYEDIFAFSRQFKATHGKSPSHYRASQNPIV